MKAGIEAQLVKAYRAGLKFNVKDLEGSLANSIDTTEMMTKAEAGYRQASDSKEMCQNCDMYHKNKTCDIVSGTIQPDGVSDYFVNTKDKNVTS